MPGAKRDGDEQSASWPPPEKKRKRKSRWTNDEADKTFIPGMPTVLPADATEDQKEQYIREYLTKSPLYLTHSKLQSVLILPHIITMNVMCGVAYFPLALS